MNKNKLNSSGTALLITILVLNVILMISLATAKVITYSVKMSGSQDRSIKAYFAGESGIERALWEWRKNSWEVNPLAGANDTPFSGVITNGASYVVDRSSAPGLSDPVILKSTGDFVDVKRTVEIQLNF